MDTETNITPETKLTPSERTKKMWETRRANAEAKKSETPQEADNRIDRILAMVEELHGEFVARKRLRDATMGNPLNNPGPLIAPVAFSPGPVASIPSNGSPVISSGQKIPRPK